MRYSHIANAYEKIEATTKRLEMTSLLVDLLRQTSEELIGKVVYLTQGKLYPDFIGIEIGIAEKLAIRAVSRATGYNEREIKADVALTGDLGVSTERFLKKKTQKAFFPEPLDVAGLYSDLDSMAKATGSGSIELKTRLLAGLLARASPQEGKYIIRTVTGSLRLGMADMTVLDALAVAFGGGKDARRCLERAYNISSDLGRVATAVAKQGIEAAKMFEVSVGEPLRPMQAERLSSPAEILEKLGGRCMAEFKYDGERIQAHKRKGQITLFSRRLENITDQYPDACRMLVRSVQAEEVIVEAECVAVDADTEEMRPFQELMHRRRKYGIKEAMEEYPIALFLFDALYIDGSDLTLRPYLVRRGRLEKAIEQDGRVRIAQSILTSDPEELEQFFENAVETGCEGLVCKSVAKDAVYHAGTRGWLWIKYKRDYKSDLTDSVDLVVVGAFHGRGKRAGTYGALLLAAYAPEQDIFQTVTKCGTGFTDEDLRDLPEKMKAHHIPHRHPRVHSKLKADVWFKPEVVIEIRGAEITLSPIHLCAEDIIRAGSGLAIRFPRFTGNYRLDKAAEDATSAEQIVGMYRSRLKKLGS